MKAIYSLYIGKNATRNNQFCGYRCKEELLDALLLTSTISAKHFDKVELYCDSEAAQLIKEDGRTFPLNIIVCLDSLSWLNEHLWAYPKVFVYFLQSEPFCHIDIDSILWNGLNEELKTKKFVFQQVERFATLQIDYYKRAFDESKSMGILPTEISYMPDYALNMAVFACTDTKYLGIIDKYFKIVDSYVKVANSRFSEFKEYYHQCILFEQLFMVNILQNENLAFEKDFDVIEETNNNYKLKLKNRDVVMFFHLVETL
jgi:hypothetical protein